MPASLSVVVVAGVTDERQVLHYPNQPKFSAARESESRVVASLGQTVEITLIIIIIALTRASPTLAR